MKKSNKNQSLPTRANTLQPLRDGLVLASAVCAAGSAGAQEPEAASAGESAEPESLPVQVVEGAKPAAPRPRPRPAPAPAPQPAPVVEVAPTIEVDTLFHADQLSTPKYTQPLRDVPQTVQVLDSDLLETQGATSLRDALRNVSGISLQAGEGGAPPGDNLSIRGFSARSDFFVDGVRDLGAYSRDPFNLEQIEIAKGPSSSITGRGSTGGSLNLVSKTAKLNDFIHADVSFGTDDLKRTTLDINQSLPGIRGSAFRLNVMGHENTIPDRGPAENSRWGIAGSLAFGLGETYTAPPSGKGGYGGKEPVASRIPNDTRLYLNFFHMEEDNLPDFGIPWTPDTTTDPRLTPYINSAHPSAFDNFYGSVSRDFEETASTMFTARFEHDFSDDFSVRNQTRVGRSERLSLLTSPRFSTTTFPAQIRRSDRKDRDEETSIFSNQTDFTVSFDTGALHHDVVTGFEFAHEEYERYNRTSDPGIDTDYFNPTPGDAIPGYFFRNGGRTTGSSDTFATYLFDTVEVNEWLDLTGGLRYERFETESTSVSSTGVVNPLRNRVDHMTSGRAAVVVKPAENGSIYFAYGTSFNPSGEFLTLSEGGRSGPTFGLEPEKSETFELGTKWDLYDERLSLTAALFRTNKTNARTFDPTDPARLLYLTGEEQVQGFETGISGEITEWWSVYASFTHLDSEVLNSLDPTLIGQRLGNTPENTFSLWNTLEFDNGFFFGGGPVFVDRRANSVGSLRVAPSFWTVDAMAGYHVNENLTLRLNISNLTDEDYIDRMSGGHFIPGEGRSAMFTASMKF